MSLAVMARVLLLALATAAPPAPEPAAAAETVLWFGSAGPGIDGVALLNAVTVYTRDLRLAVEAADPMPPPAGAADAAGPAAILRARRARLGFWCAAEGARRTVVITTIDRAGRIESHTIEDTPADEPDLYRAIALKLRTVVVAAVGTEVLLASGRPPARPSPESVPTLTAPAESAATAGPPPSPPSPRVFFALGYLFSAPLGTAPLRSAVSGEAALRLGRAGELGLGFELAPRATANAGSGSVSVFDLPLALGARLVARRGRWAAGGGGFLAAHLLWASGVASDDGGATGSSFSVTTGVGVEALARLRLGRGFAGALRAYAEETIPNTWYLVRETPTLEIGPRIGLGLGLVFPAAF
jgi:hypothetical protein